LAQLGQVTREHMVMVLSVCFLTSVFVVAVL